MSFRKEVIGDCTLILGDCLEVMAQAKGPIDMVLTDPPYEISDSSGGMLGKDGRNFFTEIDSMGMCRSGFDVTNFLTSLTLFSNKHDFNGVFFCSLKQVKEYLQFADERSLQYGMTYWHKSDPAPLCNNKYLNDVEIAIYIKGKNARIGGEYKTKSLVYKSGTNRADKRLYGHPTIKPVELIEKYLVNHTNITDRVLDPFMGSGTTGVACVNLNRKFIGIEKEEKYFDIACKRIEEAYKAKGDL